MLVRARKRYFLPVFHHFFARRKGERGGEGKEEEGFHDLLRVLRAFAARRGGDEWTL